MCVYIHLEPVCPLFWGFNPPKEGLFQSKQGSFGFQVYIYICIYICEKDEPKWKVDVILGGGWTTRLKHIIILLLFKLDHWNPLPPPSTKLVPSGLFGEPIDTPSRKKEMFQVLKLDVVCWSFLARKILSRIGKDHLPSTQAPVFLRSSLSSWWLIISPGKGENKKHLNPPPSCDIGGDAHGVCWNFLNNWVL